MENSVTVKSPATPLSHVNLGGVMRIPAVRQVSLLIGVAAAVAIGFAIVLWSQTPGYAQLYGRLEADEAAQIAEALQAAGIAYKLSDNGSILVPESRLHDARLEIAGQGLSQGTSTGMDLMADQSSFGVSQFMESARYQHALEAELARTITSLGAVREARVHLALPKQTSFLRDQKGASASVLLQLGHGGALEPDQVAAIVNMVASSVPNLTADNVTLIDQYGRLLSSGGGDWGNAQALDRFRHAERLEAVYTRRIEELLTPLVGLGRVRAQVVASLDFTVTEETRETYDPASTTLRSEQVSEERHRAGGGAAEGIPGALSNQPPVAGGETANAAADVGLQNSSRSSTRNFEVDRTISHVRPKPGAIERLSVAVLVDDSPADGAGSSQAFTDEDIQRFTALVREAVGFDAARGDTVVVVNAAFREAPVAASVDEPGFWEKPLLRDSLKQVLGVLLVLVLAFGLVRPMLKHLLASPTLPDPQLITGDSSAFAVPGQPSGMAGPPFDDKVTAARSITGHDPARVAQVVRKWVAVND